MKKLLVCLVLVSGLLGLFAAGCSPYELNDPTSAKVTYLEDKKPAGDQQKQQKEDAQMKQANDQNSVPATGSTAVVKCEKCGHEIGKLEKAYVQEGHLVCALCYKRPNN
jgi:formylmethanofuran dehydrogenase subunit E